MKTTDLKSLSNTIASVVDPLDKERAQMLQEGFLNSLTEKARQVASKKMEEEDEGEDEMEDEGEEEEEKPSSKKKAKVCEDIELAEKAAPGYEDWASDPKVKASFKKQYGKRWKEVMYGHSWNLAKQEKKVGLDEEDLGLEEGYQAKRMRVIRKAIAKKDEQGLKPEVADFMKRSFKKKTARSERITGGKGAVADLHARAAKKHAAMKAKARRLAESEQLDEAGYKRLGRIKGAAYKAELASRGADPNTSLEGLVKAAKLKRAAAELTDKVAAGMARRGGASPDAVRGGGSGIGKKGKYTKKAGKLANMRDRAIAAFHARARYNKAQGMSKSSTEKQISRNTQQFQDDIRNRSRSGDFGQDNQAALRARSNFQKRFGRLKGK